MTALCVLLATLLVSCQDESSFESSKEDIWKKRNQKQLNVLIPNGGNGGGGNGNNTAVTQQVPFDFGLSAVLGVGALAAVRSARKRSKKAA